MWHIYATQAFDYKPFGDLQSASVENRIGYFGEQRDKESDYFAMGFRLYDPEIGRFLAIDPLLDVQPSQTPYHYCFNNPTSFTDPTGLYPEKEKGDKVQDMQSMIFYDEFEYLRREYGWKMVFMVIDTWNTFAWMHNMNEVNRLLGGNESSGGYGGSSSGRTGTKESENGVPTQTGNSSSNTQQTNNESENGLPTSEEANEVWNSFPSNIQEDIINGCDVVQDEIDNNNIIYEKKFFIFTNSYNEYNIMWINGKKMTYSEINDAGGIYNLVADGNPYYQYDLRQNDNTFNFIAEGHTHFYIFNRIGLDYNFGSGPIGNDFQAAGTNPINFVIIRYPEQYQIWLYNSHNNDDNPGIKFFIPRR